MVRIRFFLLLIAFAAVEMVQAQQSPFERSKGKASATYFEAIDWFQRLDRQSSLVHMKTMGPTDAGYPLHLVLVSSDGRFDPATWHAQEKAIILINNGIHPGEPDGIDASMLLVRDIVTGVVKLPANVALAFIPVYNIGGALNRNSSSRVNQQGPLEYGFRGNSQNLDLNRDFTKCDSKEARSFAQLFHLIDPDILIDNHVSDGADYQHTFTLIASQYDKLGKGLGPWLKDTLEPALYKGMAAKQWNICPYVNFETAAPDKGWQMFYDPPRYSSGYAALFQTIGFVPETHMLKPFDQRVKATYDFMRTMIEQASLHAASLHKEKQAARKAVLKQEQFPLSWTIDSTGFSFFQFDGYELAYKPSDVTGMDRLYYDHAKPFSRKVQLYDRFQPVQLISKPIAYIIPQGWHQVIALLQLNAVVMRRFDRDTLMTVEAYHIDEYKSTARPYEKHHKNYGVKVSVMQQQVQFFKGDYIIELRQAANRYLVEMLEPTGDDSFFAWNFFDAILQQKEGYSDYRWEDVAAQVLKDNVKLQQQFDDRKRTDAAFAGNASAQLEWVYQHSKYYEPVHLRYPVFRLVQ